MKLENYQNISKTNLVPVMNLVAGSDCVFQQDQTFIHTSNSSKTFIENNIRLSDLPAHSPYLDPLENM